MELMFLYINIIISLIIQTVNSPAIGVPTSDTPAKAAHGHPMPAI